MIYSSYHYYQNHFQMQYFHGKVPGIMTFKLKCEMIESKPIKIIECKGKLYETKIEF